MANTQAVADNIRTLIAEQLGIDVDEVKDDSNIVSDLDADSLDVIEMVIGLEERFTLDIPDTDAERMATVKDVIDYVVARVGR